MGKLKPCSRCGCRVFIRSYQVRGTWNETIEVKQDGKVHIDGDGDGVRQSKPNKTIRCDGCIAVFGHASKREAMNHIEKHARENPSKK